MEKYISVKTLLDELQNANADVMADYGPEYGSEWGLSREAIAKIVESLPSANANGEQATYEAALMLWGSEAQTLMLFEEMAELQKELCKHARGKDNREAIAEEIADVLIMLEQMMILHNCTDLVADEKAFKVKRLGERIAKTENTDPHKEEAT